jgi:signal transduction histidine kinase
MNNKRLNIKCIFFILLILFSLVLTFSISSDDYVDDQIIRFGLVPDYKPFTFVDEKGNPSGFYIELFSEIIREFGYEPEFIVAPFQDLYPRILNDEIDLFSTILRIESREDLFYWPREATVTGWGQFFIRTSNELNDVHELQHQNVGIVRDEAQGQVFQEYMKDLGIIVETTAYENFEDMINAVIDGRVIGGVAQNTVLWGNEKIKATGIVFSPLNGYTTSSITNYRMIPLIDQFSERLGELKNDSNSYYWSMYKKWYSSERYIPTVLPEWFRIAVLGALSLVLLLLTFSWYLQKRVNKATMELKHLNESLEEKVAQRTVDLQKAAEKLVDSEKASITMRLVGGIAHEINTPIGIAVTATSHLESEIKRLKKSYKEDKLSMEQFEDFLDESSDVLSMTSSNLQRSADLINNFRSVNSDQSLKEKREIELNSYIKSIVKSIQPQFKKTKHKIHLSLKHCSIVTYPDILIHILLNLMINSLTHGFKDREAGHIYITAREENGHITITHTDSGCGISKETAEHIFEPFYTSNRAEGNTGLGLSIVYNFINDILKGSITVQSQLGVYTKFSIKFDV